MRSFARNIILSTSRNSNCNEKMLSLFHAVNKNDTNVSAVSLINEAKRQIRTIVPPRPIVNTLVYLDYYGKAVRDGMETDLSLVKLRDNKCYLQRVFDTGQIVRWPIPGLDNFKNVTNFQTYSIQAVDEEGGVAVPFEVITSQPNSPPTYLLAVQEIRQVKPYKKVTRKDRRSHYRITNYTWKDSEHYFWEGTIQYIILFAVLATGFFVRLYLSIKNNKPFFDYDISSNSSDQSTDKASNLSWNTGNYDAYPQEKMVNTPWRLSPQQIKMVQTRKILYYNTDNDILYVKELYWKFQHLWVYGHWPKGLNE